MERQTMVTGDVVTTKEDATLADLKLRMVEHIITQTDCYHGDDVWHILSETKVGAWKKQALLEKIKLVFSTS